MDQATEEVTKPKRVRTPKMDAEGNPVVRAPKAPKEPKQWPVWNEDGTPALDAEGNQVTSLERTKKPKAPKVVKLDEDGNPIVRSRVLPTHEQSIIRVTEDQVDKIAKYKGARQDHAIMKDGMTLLEFMEAGGDKGFLSFYVRDGACTVDAYVPA